MDYDYVRAGGKGERGEPESRVYGYPKGKEEGGPEGGERRDPANPGRGVVGITTPVKGEFKWVKSVCYIIDKIFCYINKCFALCFALCKFYPLLCT